MKGYSDSRACSGRGRLVWALVGIGVLASGGCIGFQTKTTGTSRSGAEQLLLTGTSDSAVCSVDFRPLAGLSVFLETDGIPSPDDGWVIFSLRREMARQGVLLVSDAKDAQVIVEAALGAYGTDEADYSLSLPSAVPIGFLPISTTKSPSAFSRRHRQDAIVKLGLIGLDASSGALLWESGTILQTGYHDRRILGSQHLTKRSNISELEDYPRRRW